MRGIPRRQLVSLGGGAAAVGSGQNGARRRQRCPVRVEGNAPQAFELAGGESQEDDIRARQD